MTDRNTFYVTTPIYYVNDKPHLGHVYTTMVADVVARYHRLKGDDTFFLTGTDEHATKVSDAAEVQGVTPQQWADTCAQAFIDTFAKLEIRNDDFIRTSEDRHKERVTAYIQALMGSGDVYEGEYEGWYDAGQEEYITESKARANDYKSEVTGKPLVRKKERNYFFKLSAYRRPLLDLYAKCDAAGPAFVQPEARKNEIINRIKEMEDVPISRTGTGGWGIPIPGESDQTIYVWIDALFNYLTTVDTNDRRRYWQAGAVHFIAKDILWFHAAIWPAILMALAKCDGYAWVNLPSQVYSHSYWVSKTTGEGGEETLTKMSKSLGNFLDPATIDRIVGEFGLDMLRYFLATRGPLGVSDAQFSPEIYAEVYNADLANTYGNSCSRVGNMIGKYFDGKTPEPGEPVQTKGRYDNAASESLGAYIAAFDKLDLAGAAEAALGLVRSVDAYIDETKPFTLAKDEANLPQVATILYNCAEALRIATLLLWPFLPDQCGVQLRRMGFGEHAETLAGKPSVAPGEGRLEQWCLWGLLKPGTPIEKGDALFPRYDTKKK